MDEDLRRLGDLLERAVAGVIAGDATRADDPGEDRNIGGRSRHLMAVPETEETAMRAIDTPRPTRTPRTRRTTRTRRTLLAAGIGAALLAGAGTAVAVSRLSGDDVARGLPGGSVLFTGTDPSCTSGDGVVFDCTLASAPTAEVQDDWTGAAELFVDADANIAGGCRGLDPAGLHWTCYVGQRAVQEQILAADLLGQHTSGPGRG